MKLGILDADARYAGRLAAFFRAQSGGAEEPRRFDSLQALLASGEAQRLDLVLVSPERLPDPGRLPPGPLAVYLLDEPGVEARMGRPAVFRGQRAGELLRRLEDVLAQNQPMGAVLTYRLASGERLDRAEDGRDTAVLADALQLGRAAGGERV